MPDLADVFTLPDAVLARFEAKVDRSGGPDACHIWTGAYNTPAMRPWMGTRRPIFRWSKHANAVVYAHRLALALADGVALAFRRGNFACHTCANPSCVNARHLYWGTDAENRRDRQRDAQVSA